MKNTLSENLVASIQLHEGYRDRVYLDSVGKRTIGWGWNIDDTPICEEAAKVQLMYQIDQARKECERTFDFYPNLTLARKEVLVEMCFNMGLKTLLTFKRTLSLMAASKHEKAAEQMLQSLWAQQVGQRARTLAAKYAKG